MKLLLGKPAQEAMADQLHARVGALKEAGITPKLALLRVGERKDDLSYERQAIKRAEAFGVGYVKFTLAESASQSELLAAIEEINHDQTISGCIMFQPLPKHLDAISATDALDPKKDIDCAGSLAQASLFRGDGKHFLPATPEAVMRLLDFYNIELDHKRAVVIGRSLVVGKPLALLLQARGATVSVVHTHTKEPEKLIREADICVVAAGALRMFGKEYAAPQQVVIDVGINWDERAQKLAGDVDLKAIEDTVLAASPVPGGVGALTTMCLVEHVIRAAEIGAKR